MSAAEIIFYFFAAMALVGAAPQLHALFAQPERFFARAGNTVFPFHCGFQWWGERIATNLALNLDPTYLFLSFGEYSLLSVVRLNLASLPFLYLGLLVACVRPLVHKRLGSLGISHARGLIWIPLGVLFSLAPALITEGNPSSMRSSGVWALYPIVSAIGAALSENVEPRGGNGGVNNGCAGGSVNGNGGNAGTAKRKADAVALEGQEDLMARRRFISASTMF